MRKYSVCLAVILGLLYLCSLARAQAVYTSYQLSSIQWQIAEGGWAPAEQGGLIVLGIQADAIGGFYHVQSVQHGCQWKFSWSFSQDITHISSSSGEITVDFSIEYNLGTCYTDFNPWMDIRADGDPTMITTVYAPYYNGGAFCVHPGGVCNPSPVRGFKVYRQTSVKETALVIIRIMGPRFTNVGQHAEEFKYTYTGVP